MRQLLSHEVSKSISIVLNVRLSVFQWTDFSWMILSEFCPKGLSQYLHRKFLCRRCTTFTCLLRAALQLRILPHVWQLKQPGFWPRSNHLALIFILDVSSPMVLRPMVPGLVNDPIRVLSKQFVAEAALPLLLPEVHHFDVSAECRTATQDLAACFAKVVNFVSPLWPWDRGTLYLEGNGARDNLAHGRGNFNFSGRHVYISWTEVVTENNWFISMKQSLKLLDDTVKRRNNASKLLNLARIFPGASPRSTLGCTHP